MGSETRLTVLLSGEERTALVKLAESELRDPRNQIRLILRQELESRGLLSAERPPLSHPMSARAGNKA